ncbi:MAG: serine/threonine-protein phosphatase, partial [Bacteroidetes bacterium]|nr:serine/threonine-protein phosphatase [Bacteroidota bacterium]
AEVGGDYYDVFELSDGRYGLVVADVSGKGVSAAFYMAVLKGIFLSLVRLDPSPRELLVKANRALLESLEKNAFISVVYAVLDTKNGDLVMARAGHCPVVHASAKGTELIRPNGLGLGLTEGRLFAQSTEERVIRLMTQDVCVFYTDGVTEARNALDEEFGYDRLVDAVHRHKTKDAAGIKDGILQEIRTFLENSAYTDDMTLVVIKWLACAEEKSRVIS